MTTIQSTIEKLETSLIGKTILSTFNKDNVIEVIWNNKNLYKKFKEEDEEGNIKIDTSLVGFNLPPDGSFPKILKAYTTELIKKATEEGNSFEESEDKTTTRITFEDATVLYIEKADFQFLYVIKN